MRRNKKHPRFSVIMPVYNVEIKWLEKAILSVQNQQYPHWELCIADDCSTKPEVREYLRQITDPRIHIQYLEQNMGISGATNHAVQAAKGQYLVLMDNDDELAANALQEFSLRIDHTDADILYSDQDIIDEAGNHREPLYKPDWSPELVKSQMYIGHLLALKKSLFDEVGGFRSEFNGSQDYDLFLRISEKANKIEHVAAILYHWRAIQSSTAANPESKPYAQIAGHRAVQEHLDRVYGKGRAEALETDDYFVYDVRYHLEQEPFVSVIIPTKDQAELLRNAIETIEERTRYSRYEILILNNNSEEEETFSYFQNVTKQYDNVRVEEAAFPFNWSRLNNVGIEKARGDVFIFLNNDVEIISRDWMRRLVEISTQPGVGVAGGLLLFEDNTIQHAGVVVGMGGWAEHVFRGMEPVHYGSPYVSPMVTRNVMAVTGACMAISRKTIEKIGNFNDQFIICGSDVEICIRAYEHGLRNVYCPYVQLYHLESKTRDSYVPEIDFELSAKTYAYYREHGDPYYNVNLDINSYVPRVKGTLTGEDRSWIQVVREDYGNESLIVDEIDTHIAEINPYTFRKGEHLRRRLNLLLPSINPEHVFGGISTALKFFEKLADTLEYDRRIVLVDAVPTEDAIRQYQDRYQFVSWDEESQAERQIVSYSERTDRSLPVSENDYFMFTGWWTAHCAQEAYEIFEKTEGIGPNLFINFIQDYEPGFYAWSTRFLLADATYKNPYPQIAVFNTSLLQEYFRDHHYIFFREFAFEPVLNDKLREYLEQAGSILAKKKQILIYGRPGTERNAFNLIVAALKKWVRKQDDIEQWSIVSAGEQHPRVYLGKGKYLQSVGKLTIEEYARVLAQSYAGISLMASPHPSYPPLEMSVFGVKVITNTFFNKDLGSFNSNIVSLDNISPNNIAVNLNKICDDFHMSVPNNRTNPLYFENSHVFDFINEIKDVLDKWGR
ncbi:MAG: glycosyltransferase [Lachnospiraceae bacterium]|jgi:GT2 family glycosyltransferase